MQNTPNLPQKSQTPTGTSCCCKPSGRSWAGSKVALSLPQSESFFSVFILMETGHWSDSGLLLVACDLCVSPAPLPLFRVPRHRYCLSRRLICLTEPWLLPGCLSCHKQSNQVSRRAVQTPRAVNRFLAPAKDIFCLSVAGKPFAVFIVTFTFL